MKNDCVFLGGLLIAVGATVAFMGYLSKDPMYCVVGGGIGAIFALGGLVLLIEEFLKGGLEE